MIYRLFTKLTFQFLYYRRLHSLQMFLECEDMVVHFHYILIFCEQSLRQRSLGIVTLFAPDKNNAPVKGALFLSGRQGLEPGRAR